MSESHPIEMMEPEDPRGTPFQECARLMLRAVNLGLDHIVRAKDPRRAAYEIALAFGAAGVLGDHNMTTIAKLFGVGRAAISKEVADFQQGAGLPPSPYQKSSDAVQKFKAARNNRVGQAPEEIQ